MPWFPTYIDLKGNNCTIFGGGFSAVSYAELLLKFDAKVTVVSSELCDELAAMDHAGRIRYIPRRYFRGDCSSCYICIAATGDEALNIAISDECKARAVAVCVESPAAYGTFKFPVAVTDGGVTISAACNSDDIQHCEKIAEILRRAMDEIRATQNKKGV